MLKISKLSLASYLRIFASFTLLLFPLILIITSGEIRESISDYEYSTSKWLFKGILIFTCLIYVSDGIENKKWYNGIIGASLLGVAFIPHLAYSFWHYFFAVIFFVGDVAVWIYFSSNKQRALKIFLATFIGVVLLVQVMTQLYSLLLAESLCFLPKVFHLIGEEIKMLD